MMTSKGVKPYDESKTPGEDIQDNKAAFGNMAYIVDKSTAINGEGVKPAVEGSSKSANFKELMTPVEKDFQGVGSGWNQTRPKAGK